MQTPLEQWTDEANSVVNLIERLQYVAALRDARTGVYRDVRLAHKVPEQDMDAALRRFHRSLFRYWLSLNLREQNRELLAYRSTRKAGASDVLSLAESCNALIPPGVADFERRMFVIDFALSMELLRDNISPSGQRRSPEADTRPERERFASSSAPRK